MEKLTIEQLAPYLPYELKVNLTRRLFERNNVGLMGCTFGYNDTTNEHWIYRENVTYGIYDIKPILRPLSDLTKEITHNGETFVPMEKLCNDFCGRTPCNAEFGTTKILMHADNGSALKWWFVYHRNKMTFELSDDNKDMTTHVLPQYQMFQKLHEWHFDVFGLIDKGLAVDYNLNK